MAIKGIGKETVARITRSDCHICAMLNWSRGKSFMLASTGFYAILNLCIKQLSHLPALELILFRSVISFVICTAGIYQARVHFFGNNHKWLIIRGLSGIMALWLYFSSIQKMPLASAVSIQYTSPVFTAILATFLLSEKMSPWKWLFFFLSLAGVFVMKGFDSRISLFHLLLGLTSAMFSGLAYNAVRKLNTNEHPLVIILYFPMLAIPISGMYCVFNWVQPAGIEWVLILIMGLCTQAGQFCMTRAIQLERLEHVTFLNYAGIFFALGFGYLSFNETFEWMSIGGMVMVMAGIFLNLLEKKRV